MNKKNDLKYLVPKICLNILFLFFFSIGIRFATRQILIKSLGIENNFTRLVFWDNEGMSNENGEKETKVIDWERLYPFKTEENTEKKSTKIGVIKNYLDKYALKVGALEEKINYYTTDALVGHEWLYQWRRMYNRWIGWDNSELNMGDVLMMENGYFTYQEPERTKEEIAEIADSVLDFSNYLKEEGISFYYVNAGSKVNPKDKMLTPVAQMKEFSNENGDALLEALTERKINTLDLRERMLEEELDWYGSYYKTDLHWKTETGLWVAGELASMLNEKEKFEFDSLFFNPMSYQMNVYKNCMLGGQGRELGVVALEDYTCILPKFETDFLVEIPNKDLIRRGTYQETLYDYKNLEQIFQYSQEDYLTKPDAYCSVVLANTEVGKIRNCQAEDNVDKKILFIQDSFSWYPITYLACDMGEINAINPEKFDGSIHTYVEAFQPDVVIVMYCERNILPIDWGKHNSMFDFR